MSRNSLPTLTDEQRQAALQDALRARRIRSTMYAELKTGKTTLPAVLARVDNGDEIVGRTRVLDTLKSLPGVGGVSARQLLTKARIAENRRLAGLGARQREALIAAIS